MKIRDTFYVATLLCMCALALHAAEPPQFVIGPYLNYTSPDSAVLHWQTEAPSTALIRFERPGEDYDPIRIEKEQTNHQVQLNGLKPNKKYIYRIASHSAQGEIVSGTYEIETAMNYSLQPIPADPNPFAGDPAIDRYARMASDILSRTGITKGYCVVYGIGKGRLAYELAKQSNLIVIGVDDNREAVWNARQTLIKHNLYGPRITFRHVDTLEYTDFADFFANLIVSESAVENGTMPGSSKEVYRILRPFGGTAIFGAPVSFASALDRQALESWTGRDTVKLAIDKTKDGIWAQYVRPDLKGTGTWTHSYGPPSNTSNGGDTLLGVSRTDQLHVQWVGRPGADFGIDRNPRMPTPLSINGRLFHQGMNRMIALDAYNGSILWSLEIPDLRRVNMPRDASNWCAGRDNLYVAIKDKCWKIDAYTGTLSHVFTLPQKELEQTHEWGYVGNMDGLVYGSTVKKNSMYTEFFGGETWYDQTSGPGTGKICSDSFFAAQKNSGQTVWEYHGGKIINTTITMADGQVFFVESRHPKVQNLKTSRILEPELWLDRYLVSLDAQTGEKNWEQPIDTVDGIVVFFMSYAENTVLISLSAKGNYHIYGYDGNNGEYKWHVEHPWTGNNHSGHMQHPAIVKNVIYLEPVGYDIATGQKVREDMGRHEGCSTYAATANALIYRGEARRIAMWDVTSGKVTSWMNLRPSCWLSVIPSGGMVLAPEGGGGCSCGTWLETSIGFAPAGIRQ